MNESPLERLMETHLRLAGLPDFQREYAFCTGRKWRFDFAWPDIKVALELEGGIWTGGRHTRGAGYEADVEKYNTATLAGWRVLRVTAGMIRDRRALRLITQALNGG